MGTRRLRREALHCCPACAASVGTRAHRPHRARTHAPRPWTWLALLAVTAAMIPVAAMEGGRGGATALAAAVAAPAPTAARAIVAATVADPPAPPPEAVVWRDSVAHGTPNAGSLEGGVRLPAEGPGYYTYNPATQEPPGGRDRTWGTAMLVREMRSVGEVVGRRPPRRPAPGHRRPLAGDRRLLHRPRGGPRVPPERPGRGRPPGAARRDRGGGGPRHLRPGAHPGAGEPPPRRRRQPRVRGPEPGPARAPTSWCGRTTTTTSTSASPTRTAPATRGGHGVGPASWRSGPTRRGPLAGALGRPAAPAVAGARPPERSTPPSRPGSARSAQALPGRLGSDLPAHMSGPKGRCAMHMRPT